LYLKDFKPYLVVLTLGTAAVFFFFFFFYKT
jgi:hypothetical protein